MNYSADYKLEKRDGDIGYDLQCIEDTVINPGLTNVIKTSLHVEFPQNKFALVIGRSGLSSKGIMCNIGLVDTNYRGDIGVMLYNSTNKPYIIHKGDRIGQLVIFEESIVKLNKVSEIDKDSTNRKTNGFGSSGR